MTYWFRSRWSDRRRWRTTRREFVYLDEVSVTSLIAAKHGSIPETITESLSRTSESEINASIGASGKPGNSSIGSRMKTSETSGRQVVRRAVIQGTFRDLRTGDSDLALAAHPEPSKRRSRQTQVASTQDVKTIRKLVRARRAVCIDDLQRGDVIELDVQIEAERIYQLMTALTSLVGIAEDHESFFGKEKAQLKEVKPLLDVFESMLVGLVPIIGIARHHQLLDVDGRTYIVDAEALTPNSHAAQNARPLTIVGVTEQPSYWKDLRRILFNQEDYTAYVRVTKPDLTADWNPIKLADVLETVAPGTRAEFRRVLASFESGAEATVSADSADLLAEIVAEALVWFGRKIATELGISATDDSLRAAAAGAAPALAQVDDLSDVTKVRDTFEGLIQEVRRLGAAASVPGHAAAAANDPDGDSVDGLGAPRPDLAGGTNLVGATASSDSDFREFVRSARTDAIHGILAGLSKARLGSVTPVGDPVPSAKPEQLEVEFIAIYW